MGGKRGTEVLGGNPAQKYEPLRAAGRKTAEKDFNKIQPVRKNI